MRTRRKLLPSRPKPAQDGEDEAGKSNQRSQTAVDDGEITGVMFNGDWDRSQVCGCEWHCCVALGP